MSYIKAAFNCISGFFVCLFTDDQKRPQAQVYPVFKEVILGEDFNFSCQAPGDGVSIEWMKNGQLISSAQTNIKPKKTVRGFTFNENVLMLRKVSTNDDANYTCVVRTSQNPGYSDKETATLSVKGKIKVHANIGLQLYQARIQTGSHHCT